MKVLARPDNAPIQRYETPTDTNAVYRTFRTLLPTSYETRVVLTA